MVSNICSIAIIMTAVWIFWTDPLHRFHHAPRASAQHTERAIKPALPVKRGTTGAQEWKRVLTESEAMLKAKGM